jgi:hypothetical protein
MTVTLLDIIGLIVARCCIGFLKKKRKWALLEYVFVMLFLGWLIYHMFLNHDILNSSDPVKNEIPATLIVNFYLIVITISAQYVSIWYLKTLVYLFYYCLLVAFTNIFKDTKYIYELIIFTICILIICH